MFFFLAKINILTFGNVRKIILIENYYHWAEWELNILTGGNQA